MVIPPSCITVMSAGCDLTERKEKTMITFLIDEDNKTHIEVLENGFMFSEGMLVNVGGVTKVCTKVIYSMQVAGVNASITQNAFVKEQKDAEETK